MTDTERAELLDRYALAALPAAYSDWTSIADKDGSEFVPASLARWVFDFAEACIEERHKRLEKKP